MKSLSAANAKGERCYLSSFECDRQPRLLKMSESMPKGESKGKGGVSLWGEEGCAQKKVPS